MPEYITGFSVYTLAMIGVIFIALFVVKKCLSYTAHNNKNNFLKIENCLNIEPRKNLYVVKAGREKFLIASSGENCQFMTKLDSNSFSKNISKEVGQEIEFNREECSITDMLEINSLKKYADKYSTGIF